MWLLRPLIWFAVIATLALGLQALPGPWAGWARDGCEIANCYCERLSTGWVTQTVSTYSNLGFVLVGLLVWAAPRTRPTAVHAPTYGLGLIAIGLGSGFYHASLTRLGEWFDLVGIYVLVGLMVVSNLARLRALTAAQFAAVYAGLVTAGGVQMIVASELQQVMFGGLVVAALALEAAAGRRPGGDRRWLAAGLAVFAAGVAVWVLDGRLLPCAPDAWFQWHALWHVLAAGAAGLLFCYYRSFAPSPSGAAAPRTDDGP